MKDRLRLEGAKDLLKRVMEAKEGGRLVRKRRRRIPITSVVQEGFALPGFDFFYILKELYSWIPKPVRNLRPEPIHRETVSIEGKKCRILIQVIGARNLPIRSDDGPSGSTLNKGTSFMSPKKERKEKQRQRKRGQRE